MWFPILLILLLVGDCLMNIFQAGGWKPPNPGTGPAAFAAVCRALAAVGVGVYFL